MVTGSSTREKYCLPKGEYRKKACGNDMSAHMTDGWQFYAFDLMPTKHKR